MVKNLPANVGNIRDLGSIPGREDPVEKEMETHSGILAWRILQTEKPSGLVHRVTKSQTWLKQLTMHKCFDLHLLNFSKVNERKALVVPVEKQGKSGVNKQIPLWVDQIFSPNLLGASPCYPVFQCRFADFPVGHQGPQPHNSQYTGDRGTHNKKWVHSLKPSEKLSADYHQRSQ